MVFSSLIFLFGFLPCFFMCYFAFPLQWRNHLALLFSYLFYAWGEPLFVFVLIASSGVDYVIGGYIERCGDGAFGKRKLLLIVSVILNVGMLVSFKYANFLVEQLNIVNEWMGYRPLKWSAVVLPIGISFFTFQKLSYIVDVYRKTVNAARSFVDYALYVALFPQLIAGPIIRYHDISIQLRARNHSLEKFVDGVWRFTLGLGKKVLIANELGRLADLAFGVASGNLPVLYAWLGMIAYSFQIYFDFSGYSDMAIGLGKMMGFEFLENFNRPYIARSFTEFWRRWHISLSNWMKDYLYIPLGGNRKSTPRAYLNLWIVFLISGFWHGASWTFIAWGAFHGFFLTVDKVTRQKIIEKMPSSVLKIVTFVLISFGWVIFRSDNIGQAFNYIKSILGMGSVGGDFSYVEWYYLLDNRTVFVMILAGIFSFFPLSFPYVQKNNTYRFLYRHFDILKYSTIGFLFFFSVLSLVSMGFNPFIYFRF